MRITLSPGSKSGQTLVTQNVDRLHQAARSRAVIDLHGRFDLVRGMDCLATTRRSTSTSKTTWSGSMSPGSSSTPPHCPDGDADLDQIDFSGFVVPPCASCGGILKPEALERGRRHAGRRFVADRLIRLSICPNGSASWHPDRSRQAASQRFRSCFR
jgi:NAD-dependent SIR2 family protein deacetylase